jgi:hypothetical protein
MSEIIQAVSFPLDEEGFFRRECPFCMKEFKVLLTADELNNISQREIESYMIEQNDGVDSEGSDDSDELEYICPYCGQTAPAKSWWTQEQIEYLHIFARNILADLVNEHLIRPMKNTFRGQKSSFISLTFEGNELEKTEAWISLEINDMKVFELACCNRRIKINDDHKKLTYCFFCGFPHEPHEIEK